MRNARLLAAGLFLGVVCAPALAADRIRIAAQKTGTFAWELAIMRARGLDTGADLDLVVTELASPEAGKIALKGGSADLIVADVMWVARERAIGGSLLYYPYTSTLGAIMTPVASSVAGIETLKGRKFGVAGGALDKSWLLLQAWARKKGIDIKKETQVVFGAPQLLAVKLEQGELDASMNYWNICAELEAKGFRRMIEMADVERDLGAKGPVAMIGYAFEQSFAGKNGAALARYFKAADEAKNILASEPDAWKAVAARTGISDPKALETLRKRYSDGIPRRALDDEEADARALYKVLVEVGGAELAGPAKDLGERLYWRAGAGG
jgi:NitT/TauT family transport system substrate-binding protein